MGEESTVIDHMDSDSVESAAARYEVIGAERASDGREDNLAHA